MLKAIGGGTAALAASLLLHRSISAILLSAGIIALSANAVNLTDTRPGRCLSACYILAAIAALFGIHHLNSTICVVFAPPIALSIVLFIFDRSARMMIGDVGSNLMGGLVGLLWTVVTPVFPQAIYLFFLIWFHWWTESHSLSRTIESTRWLRRIDRFIGTRA
jgi:UDP-N-acetylmuramyl pentapeptide phosphotransferase/UDP-N-acetylglucosamine-1-phosphate transferase